MHEGDDLQKITPAAPEDEHVARIRILSQNLFGLCRRRVEPAPHIRDAGSQPNPRVARHRDHCASPDGFHAWTPEEIAQFEEAHPMGTTARLALALALYTGQRRSDLVLLGRQHMTIHDGTDWLRFTQKKNKRNKPVHMEIPIAPELRIVMDATKMGDMSFLVNGYGRPFTSNGFGNKFRDWCNAACLPHCAVHGLRKAAAARLAELGCTEQEIMSITGHKTSKEMAQLAFVMRAHV
jgi:integrase